MKVVEELVLCQRDLLTRPNHLLSFMQRTKTHLVGRQASKALQCGEILFNNECMITFVPQLSQ